jgi:RNA polymerase sigma-70 factor, ECF subfamily
VAADEIFEQLRPGLTSASYQILGSWADAEDVVQITWLKWRRLQDSVESPRAWLTKVAVHASIDGLRARQGRRETYPGEWLPEPVSREPGPEDLASDDRAALSLGVLVMMESLSPLERAVFVLRRGFGWPYEEIAEILDRSPEAVRQLDHRARAHLQQRPERFTPDPQQVRSATERFLAACGGGSIEELMEVLAPDVVLHSDGGGEAKAPPRQIRGPEKVARFFVAVVQRALAESEAHIVDVNGQPGVLTLTDGRRVSALTFDLEQGRITDLYLVAAPSKLGALRLPA